MVEDRVRQSGHQSPATVSTRCQQPTGPVASLRTTDQKRAGQWNFTWHSTLSSGNAIKRNNKRFNRKLLGIFKWYRFSFLFIPFIFILWYLEKLCVNVISWKKCFYTKCRVANIGRSIIPGHESGMERRREDHHLQSSHFFIQSQEKRVDSGQCGHSLETGDLQTRKLIEYFVVRHHKPRHSPQPFLRIRLSSTCSYVIGGKNYCNFGHSCCTFCNGAIVMISSSPLL